MSVSYLDASPARQRPPPSWSRYPDRPSPLSGPSMINVCDRPPTVLLITSCMSYVHDARGRIKKDVFHQNLKKVSGVSGSIHLINKHQVFPYYPVFSLVTASSSFRLSCDGRDARADRVNQGVFVWITTTPLPSLRRPQSTARLVRIPHMMAIMINPRCACA